MTSRVQEIASDDKKEILRLETKPFGTNAYMVICRKTSESVLIDAPGSAATIKERLKDTYVKYILMTHGHMDHVTDLEELHRDRGRHWLCTKRMPGSFLSGQTSTFPGVRRSAAVTLSWKLSIPRATRRAAFASE